MKLVTMVVAIGLMAGCAGNKELSGTAIGAAAGGILAKATGGNKAGVAAGVFVGGLIGNRLGKYLDDQDRIQMAALEKKALETGSGGSFVSGTSKAKVTIEAAPPTLEKPRDYGMTSSAKTQPIVLIDPITIRAYVDTPVFNSTNENETPKLVVQQGVPMQISAKVANDNWSVVGNDRVGLGYVPRRYLEAGVVSESKAPPAMAPAGKPPVKKVASAPKPSAAPAPAPAPQKAPTPMTKEQYDAELAALNAAYSKSNPGQKPDADKSAPASAPATVKVVQASSECKLVSRKVTPPTGEPFSEQIKYCNEPPKGWQTVV